MDAATALHVEPTLEVGKCTYGTGVMTSDIYDIFIRVEGKGGHSSQPETTINALAAANGIYHTLSGLVQREVSGFDTAILALCSMHAGSQSSPHGDCLIRVYACTGIAAEEIFAETTDNRTFGGAAHQQNIINL